MFVYIKKKLKKILFSYLPVQRPEIRKMPKKKKKQIVSNVR
jgi:hypothetical protein